MPTKKYRLTKLQSDGSTLLTMHQETDADIVLVDNTSGHYQGTATNVQDALEEVYTAVENLPQPMIFKGTLGTGGTITTLPSASSSNEGYTYKVITAGTYQSVVCKVGDVVISNGSAWTLIPAGDDVEDTWRAIYVGSTELAGNGIDTGKVSFDIVSGTHLTVFGSSNPGEATVHYGVANGYSIPSDADFSTWNAKYDLPSGGIPATDLATGVQSSLSKADTALQSNQTITLSGDASGSGTTSIPVTIDKDTSVTSGSTKPVTSGAVYDAIEDAKEEFLCTYGTTTYSAITQALADNKTPIAYYNNILYRYIKTASVLGHVFTVVDVNYSRRIYCDSSNVWGNSYITNENEVNKTQSLSVASTTTQYPSAKCVYDNLQTVIGNIPTKVSDLNNDSGFLTSSDVDQTYSSSSTNAQSGVAIASAVQDVMEVAQGKAANYVCSDVTNAVLNSQNNVVTITSSLTDIKGDSITIDNLKIGDSIYVTETDVPDRWVGAFGGSPLPSEYKELTYIQNTGTGYVDLGFVPIANSTVYVSCNKNSSQSQANHSLFGVGSGGSVYSLNFVSQRGYDIGYAGWTSINTAEYHNDGLDHIWKAHMYSGEQKIYRDDVLIVSGTRTGNVDTAGNMYAFRSDLSYNTKMKLYYLYVIDDNDVKVHDFRPCYRVADNVIGLYDVSTSTFCPATNQSSFSIGNTITRTSVDLYKLETAKVPVSDVQVNGTSVVTNNIANVSVPTNYVTTDTSQTISAQKKFTTAPILDWKVFLRSKYSSAEDYTNVIGVGASGNVEFGNQWHDSMITAKDRIYPNADNKVDFGSASYRYKNLYLTGQIKDGNNADYGLVLPNSTSYTANKTIATTDDIPEQEMYWCTYNTTTYAQISQALSDGKVPMIKYNGITYMYSKDWGSSLGHLFGTMDGNFARWVYCKQTSVWGTGYMEVENSVNKTQALSSSSTVTQYPSAKCVYTALQTKSTVSGADDGTNWTALTIDGVTKGLASNGGTQLYQHNITYSLRLVGQTITNQRITIVSKKSTALNGEELAQALSMWLTYSYNGQASYGYEDHNTVSISKPLLVGVTNKLAYCEIIGIAMDDDWEDLDITLMYYDNANNKFALDTNGSGNYFTVTNDIITTL